MCKYVCFEQPGSGGILKTSQSCCESPPVRQLASKFVRQAVK
jgi:hypothetical protein